RRREPPPAPRRSRRMVPPLRAQLGADLRKGERLMYLKSPDPTGHAVIAGGRLYPVRDGAFLIPDSAANDPVFEGFQRADVVSAEAQAELKKLGSNEHQSAQATAEPAAAVALPSHSDLPGAQHVDELLEAAADELKSVMAEKNALAEKLRELV